MNTRFRASITGVSRYLPDGRLTNADLEKIVDTTDEWIQSRTGIRERRILDDGLATSFLATRSLENLLEQKGLDAKDVELIIVATITPDMMFPATACLVQDNVGAKKCVGVRPFCSLLWISLRPHRGRSVCRIGCTQAGGCDWRR